MRLGALIQGHLWDMRRNPMLIMAPGMAIIMAVLWAVSFRTQPELLPMTMAMGLAFTAFSVGWQLPSITIAEEKEKRTLEAVLLTPVRPGQVLTAKLIITGVTAVVTALITLPIYSVTPKAPATLAAGFLLALLFTMSAGTFMGLICPDTKTVGLTSTFLMLAAFFTGFPIFQEASATAWAIFAYFPGRPIFELLNYGINGYGDDMVRNILVLLGYTVLAIVLCIRTMRKQAFER